ncbi:MAG: hypothetical protein KDJ27_15400 [Gammaproteobacteria bacterium]|nr:hypothetical protein [Gammaproteobacteria bacterium]
MLGKILFTLAVIVLVALVWRTRQSRTSASQYEPRLVNPPMQRRWPIRGLAIGIVGLMVAAFAYLLYDHWRDNNEVIFIRVVDASSGRAAEYRAARGDIDDRSFTTVDGRRIVLAETERLETSTIRSPVATDRN